MESMMNRKIPVLLLILLVMLGACKLKRETKKEIKGNVKQDEGVDFIFSKMKASQLDFRTLSMKFQATVESDKDKSVTFNGNMRIVKDRAMWLSLSAILGVEAFRVIITQDSVKMINRLNKTYFKGDYQLINNLLKSPFDFDMLQALVTGNDFSYYENNIFKVGEDDLTYKISTLGRKKLKNYVANADDMDKVLVQDMWIAPGTFKIVRQQIKEISKQNSKVIIDYGDFEELGNQLFPKNVTVVVETEQKMSIFVKYEKVALDEEVTIPFTIPESYRPMEQQPPE
jgi:hypothetical protein